jgi:hypothetical protein
MIKFAASSRTFATPQSPVSYLRASAPPPPPPSRFLPLRKRVAELLRKDGLKLIPKLPPVRVIKLFDRPRDDGGDVKSVEAKRVRLPLHPHAVDAPAHRAHTRGEGVENRGREEEGAAVCFRRALGGGQEGQRGCGREGGGGTGRGVTSRREAMLTLGERYDASIFRTEPMAPSMAHPA